MLAELAMEGALTESVRWPGAAPVTHLVSAAHRVYQPLPTCARGFVFRSGGCEAEGAEPPEITLPAPPSDRFRVIDDGMMLALADYDPLAVVERVRYTAEPLSQPLWAKRHDPYPAWSKLFQAAVPEMLKHASSTDEFLKQALEKRLSDARKMRKVAALVGLGQA